MRRQTRHDVLADDGVQIAEQRDMVAACMHVVEAEQHAVPERVIEAQVRLHGVGSVQSVAGGEAQRQRLDVQVQEAAFGAHHIHAVLLEEVLVAGEAQALEEPQTDGLARGDGGDGGEAQDHLVVEHADAAAQQDTAGVRGQP